jgi:hypothetical protein
MFIKLALYSVIGILLSYGGIFIMKEPILYLAIMICVVGIDVSSALVEE